MSESIIQKIVVGTDFNQLAAAALRFAGGIAGRAGAELIVVYADTFDPPAEFTAAQVPHFAVSIERSRKKAREQLEAHVAEQIAEGVVWKAVVADGLPATSLSSIATAEGADFIILGTHGRGGLERLVIGSVAEAVMREAPVPVLTVRSTELPAAVRRVICPVNASETAAAAASHAARIAGALDAELTLLHVSTGTEEKDFDAEALVPKRGPRSTVLRLAVEDDARSSEILRIADSGDYDLIVVGAEHRLLRDVTLFGTTTARVTRHARTPVLTVTRHQAAVPKPTSHAETRAV